MALSLEGQPLGGRLCKVDRLCPGGGNHGLLALPRGWARAFQWRSPTLRHRPWGCSGEGREHRPAGSLRSLLWLDTVRPRLRRPRGGGGDSRRQQEVVEVALCGTRGPRGRPGGQSATVTPIFLRRWEQRALRRLVHTHLHSWSRNQVVSTPCLTPQQRCGLC